MGGLSKASAWAATALRGWGASITKLPPEVNSTNYETLMAMSDNGRWLALSGNVPRSSHGRRVSSGTFSTIGSPGQIRYEIVLAPEAAKSYRALPAYQRVKVRDALERHLRHEPTRVSKSLGKRPRGLSQPLYRLRVGGGATLP